MSPLLGAYTLEGVFLAVDPYNQRAHSGDRNALVLAAPATGVASRHIRNPGGISGRKPPGQPGRAKPAWRCAGPASLNRRRLPPLRRNIHAQVLQRRVLAGIAEVPHVGIPIQPVDAAIGCRRLQLGGSLAHAANNCPQLPGGFSIPIAGGDWCRQSSYSNYGRQCRKYRPRLIPCPAA